MEGQEHVGFFKRLVRFLRNLLIFIMIIVPCLYAVKVRLNLRKTEVTVDSLRTALAASYARLDSMKRVQDDDMLTRDYLDDLVDRKLGENASNAMISIDTTLDEAIARRIIKESMSLDYWVDSLIANVPEGVAAHVKLHYIKSKAVRLERLDHHCSTKFED